MCHRSASTFGVIISAEMAVPMAVSEPIPATVEWRTPDNVLHKDRRLDAIVLTRSRGSRRFDVEPFYCGDLRAIRLLFQNFQTKHDKPPDPAAAFGVRHSEDQKDPYGSTGPTVSSSHFMIVETLTSGVGAWPPS